MFESAALALMASILIGATTILLKECVKRTNPVLTMLVVTLVGTIVFLAVAWSTVPADHLRSPAVGYFVVAGIFSPALVRWLYLVSLKRIGASISSSILATGPAYTAIIAVVFLKERITFLRDRNEVTAKIVWGAALVVTGIVLITIDQAR